MKKNALSALIECAMECFKRLKMTKGTMQVHRSGMFRPIENRLGPDAKVDAGQLLAEEQFFRQEHASGQISRRTLNMRVRGIRILSEIIETGTFEWHGPQKKEKQLLASPHEALLASFGETLECGKDRKNRILSLCRRFLASVEATGVTATDQITSAHVRKLALEMSRTCPKSMDMVMSALRRLLEHMRSKGLLEGDFWRLLCSAKCRDRHVQPCIETDEISRILGTIDRSSATGKRDFAMICLGAVTGLRACDVAALRLGDIRWKELEPRIVQAKTGEPLVVPVAKPVLDAVADYIANGRPGADSDRVFVRHLAPFQGFRDGVSVANAFRRRAEETGIGHKPGDGRTFHGMRRRLGAEMVAGGTPVDTVAQVLGHKGTKATRQYVSADMEHLRLCALGFDSLGDAR